VNRHTTYRKLLARRCELTAREERNLRAHLADCVDCVTLAAAYRREDALLRPLRCRQSSPQVRQRILDRVQASRHRRGIARGIRLHTPATAVAAAAGFVLLIAAAVVWRGGVTSPFGHARPTVAANFSACGLKGPGWSVPGQCRIIASPEQFRTPTAIFYGGSLRWVKTHMQDPRYVVRPRRGFPVAFSTSSTDVRFSEVAFDPRGKAALYAIGRLTR
jgi:hypothetical protein